MIQTLKLLQHLKELEIDFYQEGDKLRTRDSNKRLTDELRNQIKANKSVILDRLSSKQPSSITTIYGLSPMQAGMLFHTELAPAQGTYIEHSLFHVDDPDFEAARFIQAIQCVIDRHDSLRAAFRSQPDGEALQLVYQRAVLPVTLLDWRDLSSEVYQPQLAHLLERDRLNDFELSVAPLLRLTLIERAPQGYDLLLTFHHILMDRWSVNIFWSEVLQVYAGQPLPTVTPYQAYIHHLRQQPADAPFWRSYLQGFAAPTPLPAAIHPTHTPGKPASLSRCLSLEASQQLTAFAREQRLTLNTLFQAAWALLLARYTCESDVIFGMVTSGRTAPIPGIDSILGLLINTVPFHVHLDATLTATALLQQMLQTQMALQQREHTPLVDVQRWSELPAGTRLFETIFLFQNTPQTAAERASLLDLRPGWVETGDTGYPLVVLVAPGASQEAVTLLMSYDTAWYDAETVTRLLAHWQQLLLGMVQHPDQPVLHLPMLTTAEYQQIVHEWNDTAVDFGPPQTIHALFEQQVAQTPNATAVVSESRFQRATCRFEPETLTLESETLNLKPETLNLEPETLIYAELNARANQLAHHLIELGVQADTLVAIAMERSIEMVVSLLAVLKAGGAYVPIDPTYPPERIRYMLADSAAPILLTQSHLPLAQEAAQQIQQVILVDTLGTQLARQPIGNPQTTTAPADLAYVIYTSGSTGKPKGVLLTHHSLCNVTTAHINIYNIQATSRIFQTISFSFDVATANIFMTLCAGATLVLPSPQMLLVGDTLLQHLHDHSITHLPAPIPILSSLPYKDLPLLQTIIVGGETAPMGLIKQWSAHYTLFNAYGPTEATISATIMRCNAVIDAYTSIPIGRPLSNVQVFILDRSLQPVSIGVAGELYIGGVQLARGYLNRPDLTAERFINHPAFGRLYKTGDLCRWLPAPNGLPNIEFLGRIDFQVKIRGFRIELGEIESALLAQAGVRTAVVFVREDAGDKRLVAYFVGEADPERLRQALAQRLPEYMVPGAFVRLDALPDTPNGKLDRKALPAPDYAAVQSAFVAPRTAMESKVAAIWQEVLGITQVGVYDNFFALGGHSLLATQVVSQIRTRLMIELPLKSFFEAKTLGDLSVLIKAGQGRSTDEEQLAYEELI